jgi:vitamin B12 transporter
VSLSLLHPGRSARTLRVALLAGTALNPLLAGAASAQQTIAASTNREGTVALPTIVVSPTGIPTPEREVASTVTVITADQLEREQRRTLPDALQRVPGLNVVQSGGPGGQTSVFVRGTNANHVKVLVDGIDVSDPASPGRTFDFGQLLTEDIARIEVLRGPQSGLYGADAIGGVISITTKKGEGPPRATLRTEAGSYGTFNQSGTLSGSNGGFNYFFGVQHFRSEAVPVTPPALVPPGQRINPNNYDNATYTTRLGFDVTDNLSLNYVARFIDSRLLLTTDSGFPSLPNAFRSRQDDIYFFNRGEAVVALFDGRFKNYFGLGYSDLHTSTFTPPTLFGPTAPTITFGTRSKADYRGEFNLFQGATLLFGAEREDERLNDKTIKAQNGNTAGYVELQADYDKRFFLVANMRHDENDAFGGATTYRVAPAVVVPGTETKLKASLGTGFKAPTLNQLYVSFPAFNFFANPNLRPEKSFGWDVGFEQPLRGERIRFGATYFETDIKNLIAANATFTTSENIGRATAYGVEAFVSYLFSDELQARVDYTNTTTKDEIARQELLRRPRHKVSMTWDYRPTDRLALSATAIFVGPQVDGNRDFSIPRLRTNPYTLVNLAATYKASDQVDVFARVDNLFDRRIEDPTGFLRPGLSAYAGLRVTN